MFLAFEVAGGEGAAAVASMRALGIEGLSVTMPHKDAVASAVDELSPAAEAVGAVNTVVCTAGKLVGENTDGDGFLDAIVSDEGFDPAGRRCVVFGAGGAARAVIRALAGAGAAEVVVVNRDPDRGRRAAEIAPPISRSGLAADAAKADLVVNATSLGMDAGDPLPVDPSLLGPGQLVVDLVYYPLVTPLLESARASGATAVNGLGMLLHQAAHAFRLWTAEDPPLEVMSAAALGELTRRQGIGGSATSATGAP